MQLKTMQQVSAGTILLVIAVFAMFQQENGYYINDETQSIVEGVVITGSRQRALLEKTRTMQSDLRNLGGSEKPKEIPQDDWELFREVLNDLSKITDIRHIGAMIRLLRTVEDSRLKEILKELLCDALPELCKDAEAESPNTKPEAMFTDADVSVRTWNVLWDFCVSNGKDPKKLTLREVLEDLRKFGNGSVEKGFLQLRNVGKHSLKDLKDAVKGVDKWDKYSDSDLYEEYFEK